MPEKPKIIIATGIFPPELGGPATYSERLAMELKRRGFDISLITYFNSGVISKKYDFSVIKIYRLYPAGLRHFFYFWRLLKIAKDADLIYAQCPISSGLPAYLASKVLKKKFVLKIVGDYAWEQAKVRYEIREGIETFQNKKTYPRSIRILRWLEKRIAKGADQIIVPSYYLKKIVAGWGVDSDKINVVFNSIEDIVIDNKLNKVEAQSQIGMEGDILFSAGRLVSWKGFDILIKIMPDLLKKNVRFKLVIAGSGPEESNLKNLISSLRLENYVYLIGGVEHLSMPIYFRAVDLFVLNTKYEGLSHILLEAMRNNLPIITTNIGGNPEIIKHNYNGLLIEADNKEELKNSIWNLWQDEQLKKEFIGNSQKVLEKFTFEKMIEETIKVLFL